MVDSITNFCVKYNTEITIIVFVSAFIIIAIYRKLNEKSIEPFILIGGTISAALAPSGVTLILLSLNPKSISNLENFRLFIAVAGIILICIAIKAIFHNLK